MKNNMEIRHIADLAMRSYNNNQYTFTNFLTPAIVSDFYDALHEFPPCGYAISGGYEGAERVIIRFGREDELGYLEAFPIVYVCIEPCMAKFADQLTHRDVLGAIMNLGMEREKLGDIIVKDNRIWVVCLENMARLIIDELTKVKHTSVRCKVDTRLPDELTPQYEEMRIQVAQERIDAVVAKLCKLSRNASSGLFIDGRVAVNGRENKNHSYLLKENDVISVRGYGKFRYLSTEGNTRKGNKILIVERFV